MPLEQFGDYVLLTNFHNYLLSFAEQFDCDLYGEDRPMQAATNGAGLSIINFGIGSPNAAMIMDLSDGRPAQGRPVPGQVRWPQGVDRDWAFHPADRRDSWRRDVGRLPACRPFPHCPRSSCTSSSRKSWSNASLDYRTGVVYTTNRRVWEHDQAFQRTLREMTCIAIDMETATLFVVGHKNQIARGALLLVSDLPLTPEGFKTEVRDAEVTQKWAQAPPANRHRRALGNRPQGRNDQALPLLIPEGEVES